MCLPNIYLLDAWPPRTSRREWAPHSFTRRRTWDQTGVPQVSNRWSTTMCLPLTTCCLPLTTCCPGGVGSPGPLPEPPASWSGTSRGNSRTLRQYLIDQTKNTTNQQTNLPQDEHSAWASALGMGVQEFTLAKEGKVSGQLYRMEWRRVETELCTWNLGEDHEFLVFNEKK